MTNFDGILKIASLLNRVALVVPRGDLQSWLSVSRMSDTGTWCLCHDQR